MGTPPGLLGQSSQPGAGWWGQAGRGWSGRPHGVLSVSAVGLQLQSEASGLPVPAAQKQGLVLGRGLVSQCLCMQALVSTAMPGCAQGGGHCDTPKWAGESQVAAGRKGS